MDDLWQVMQARSWADLIHLVDELTGRGVRVEFVREGMEFDPAADDPYTRGLMQVMGTFAELERNLIRSRQGRGHRARRGYGVYNRWGRPQLARWVGLRLGARRAGRRHGARQSLASNSAFLVTNSSSDRIPAWCSSPSCRILPMMSSSGLETGGAVVAGGCATWVPGMVG